jgi:O-antigen/teichoic acid export membrane protein
LHLEHSSSVARGATSLYGANMVTLLAGMVYFVIMTNLFRSTIEVGVVTALNIWIWFVVTFCILATPILNQNPIPAPLAVLKFIPELLAKNQRAAAVRVLRSSVWVALILGFVAGGFLIISPSLFTPLLGGSAVLPNFVQLAGVDVIVVSVGQVGLAAVIALGETGAATRYIWIWAIVRYTFASVLLLPLGVVGVLVGWIVGDLSLVYFSLTRSLRGAKAPSPTSTFSFKALISYSAYNLTAALIGFTISQADRFFTLATQGLSPLAVYNVAIVASSIASSAPYALVTVMLPAVVALYASNKMEELHRLIRLYTRYLSILVMPVAFGLAAVMEIPLRIFGAAYTSGTAPAVIVSVAAGLTALSAIYASALLALGKMRWFTAANLVGLGGFFVVTSYLTPILGLSGPAFGRAALMIIASMIYAFATFRAGVFELDLRAYLISIACSTMMAVMVFAAISLFHSFYARIAALPVLIVFGFLTYLGLVRVCRLVSQDDLEFIRAITPRAFHRFLPIVARLVGVRY